MGMCLLGLVVGIDGHFILMRVNSNNLGLMIFLAFNFNKNTLTTKLLHY